MTETDLGVLVRSDRCEGSLREGEGLKNTPAHTEQVVRLNDVEARVVAMHWVQDDLQRGKQQLDAAISLPDRNFTYNSHIVVAYFECCYSHGHADQAYC